MAIRLGQRVRDVITGFEGVADCRMEWLNGCVRIQVQPPAHRERKGGAQTVQEAKVFDEEQLEVLELNPLRMPGSRSHAMQAGGGRKDPDLRR